ncbi:MAG: hypothetical protein JWL64_844 [Frankiales bacterium]|nr:hypothetical protein [Frankiales bacterium]
MTPVPRAVRDPRQAARARGAEASRSWLVARESAEEYPDELDQARRVLRALARDDSPR